MFIYKARGDSVSDNFGDHVTAEEVAQAEIGILVLLPCLRGVSVDGSSEPVVHQFIKRVLSEDCYIKERLTERWPAFLFHCVGIFDGEVFENFGGGVYVLAIQVHQVSGISANLEQLLAVVASFIERRVLGSIPGLGNELLEIRNDGPLPPPPPSKHPKVIPEHPKPAETLAFLLIQYLTETNTQAIAEISLTQR